MFAVIDCGTTNTRVYILNDESTIVSETSRQVGVRNTSMIGTKDELRKGLSEAVVEAVGKAGLQLGEVEYAIASGMITSEIGLVEIPHLVAPVGIEELARNVKIVPGREIMPLDMPIMFIPGIRNDYGNDATLADIENVDFMRGEETQVIGILDAFAIKEPVNVLVLSSHTKVIHTNKEGKVQACMTTLSGQLFDAIISQTNVGKSLADNTGEQSGGYTFEEIVDIATECVHTSGLVRCFLIPRFMQVLLKTDYKERRTFLDAAIAVDDMDAIKSFNKKGFKAENYILFGHEPRCRMYSYLLKKEYDDVNILSVSDPERLGKLTVMGAVKIANLYKKQIANSTKENS